jgi:hypothetical protein
MNRSMTLSGLSQPGSTMSDDYGAVSNVVRMRPGGHVDPAQAYSAPPAPEPEPEVEVADVSVLEMIDNDDGSDLNGPVGDWLKGTFGKEARQGRQAERQSDRAALKEPITVPARGTDPGGYSYLLYPDHSVYVQSGPDSEGQTYPPNSQVAQNVARAYGPHPAYRRGEIFEQGLNIGKGLLERFLPGQPQPAATVVQKKDNTALYVGLGIAGVAAIAATVYFVQRGK